MARFGNPANDQAEAKFTIVEKDTVNDIALIHTLPMSSIRVPKLSVGDPEEAERICMFGYPLFHIYLMTTSGAIAAPWDDGNVLFQDAATSLKNFYV